MADEIRTRYLKGGFAKAEDIVLSETPRTRTIFRPGVHSGGVRGEIIRQKIGKDGTWKDTNEVNFSQVPADCGVAIELDTEATTKLYNKLKQLQQVQSLGVEYGEQDYVVGKKGEVVVVDDNTKASAINDLLEQGHSEEFWHALTQKDPDLASRLALAKVQLDRKAAIAELEDALNTERENEAFWQDFFSRNTWILQAVFSASVFILQGETYLGGKLPMGRQGKGGVATDFLGSDESTKSFAVVEIKTPGTGLVGPRYRGDEGSGLLNEVYTIHPELSGGIVQIRNQIAVAVEKFNDTLGEGFAELNRVHPKGVLIAGTLDGLDQRQQASLNYFRQGLFSLTVITYDEVLRRLRILFEHVPSPLTEDGISQADSPNFAEAEEPSSDGSPF